MSDPQVQWDDNPTVYMLVSIHSVLRSMGCALWTICIILTLMLVFK